jgi:hypothetical protein
MTEIISSLFGLTVGVITTFQYYKHYWKKVRTEGKIEAYRECLEDAQKIIKEENEL